MKKKYLFFFKSPISLIGKSIKSNKATNRFRTNRTFVKKKNIFFFLRTVTLEAPIPKISFFFGVESGASVLLTRGVIKKGENELQTYKILIDKIVKKKNIFFF